MRWWQRVVTLLCVAFFAVFGTAVLVDTADEVSDRVRARDGAVADGVVVERYRSPKAWFPTVTVEYEVAGRRYERELDGYLDVGERVRVRHLPDDPAVSRVEDEGGAGLVVNGVGSLLLLGAAPFGARTALRDLRRRPEPRPERAPDPERPGDRRLWRRRTTRGAVAGAGAGGLLWCVLAALLGAGPPREVATALLGLVGSGAAAGALVGLLASGGSLRRTGRALPYRLAVAALVLAVPGALLLAAALEG